MKTILTLFFALASFVAIGQSLELPRTEFKVDVSENRLSLKPGESKQVNVLVLRSKGYARAEATFGLMSAAIPGIQVSYDPASGLVDSAVATITIGPEVPAGDYSLVLSATLNHKKKGAIVKVSVSASTVAAN